MPKRRPSGDGMVRKRTTDGRWEGRIVVGHKENGLPIYQTVLASTQKELTSKLNSYRESFKGVNLTEDSRMSLGAWLDKWLDEHMAFTLRPSTLKGHRHIVNDYIKPHLGGKQIYAVTTADVQKMYNALKKNGKLRVGADGEKGLSGSTVRSVHMVLHEAMEYALREHLIVRNPTESTTIPKASGAVMNILNDEQLDRFMEAIRQEPLWHDLFYTAITTGLRRGELCGLMWTDFDSDSGTLKIKRTLTADGAQLYVGDTKTVSGEREILLPSSTAELLRKRKAESRSKWIFGDWMDFWFREFATPRLKESTREIYGYRIYKQIIPRIGHIPLKELKQADLQGFYASLKKEGRLIRTEQYGEGLSDAHIRSIHAHCKAALDKAVEQGLIYVNPAKNCKLPSKRSREMQILTKEEMQRLLIQAIAFILYATNVWTPTLTGIALLFGIGNAFDSVVSLVAYMFLLKKEKINILKVE